MINNLYLVKFATYFFKMSYLVPSLLNHKTSYPQVPNAPINEMHLKEAEQTLRCGKKASAYFLEHSCLAFGEKSFYFFIFCFDGYFSGRMEGRQRATSLAKKLRWQLCIMVSLPVMIPTRKIHTKCLIMDITKKIYSRFFQYSPQLQVKENLMFTMYQVDSFIR